MPRPTDNPQWATDSAYVAPGRPWNGFDPKLAPPAGLIAEGWEPGVAPNARFVNWLLNLFARWLEYLRDERDALYPYLRPDLAASRGAYLSHLQGHPQWDPTDVAPGWVAITGAYTQHRAGTLPRPAFFWGAAAGGPLPTQCTVTAVRVFVDPSNARTGTDRMALRVYRANASGLGLTQVGATAYDAGTDGLQAIEVTGLNVPLSNDDSSVYGLTALGLVIELTPGASPAGVDRVHMAEIRFTTTVR